MQVFKGWNAKIYFSAGGTIDPSGLLGYADSASVEIASGLEAYYEVGSRQPVELVEGNEEITGSFSRAWVNTDYLNFMGAGGSTLTEFALEFQVVRPGSSTMFVYCYACKFETGSLDIPQDGILKEDYDFRAKSIHLSNA